MIGFWRSWPRWGKTRRDEPLVPADEGRGRSPSPSASRRDPTAAGERSRRGGSRSGSAARRRRPRRGPSTPIRKIRTSASPGVPTPTGRGVSQADVASSPSIQRGWRSMSATTSQTSLDRGVDRDRGPDRHRAVGPSAPRPPIQRSMSQAPPTPTTARRTIGAEDASHAQPAPGRVRRSRARRRRPAARRGPARRRPARGPPAAIASSEDVRLVAEARRRRGPSPSRSSRSPGRRRRPARSPRSRRSPSSSVGTVRPGDRVAHREARSSRPRRWRPCGRTGPSTTRAGWKLRAPRRRRRSGPARCRRPWRSAA